MADFSPYAADGVTGIHQLQAELFANCADRTFQQTFCGTSFILGLFLIFISKKLMKSILALLSALVATVCVFHLFEILSSRQESDQYPALKNGWVIAATCGGAALLVMIISRVYIKATVGAFGAVGFGLMSYFLVAEVQNKWVGIVCVVIGAALGYVFGNKFSKSTMKFIGAVLGSFLIVSSIGFFLDDGILDGEITHFNLVEFANMARTHLPAHLETEPALVATEPTFSAATEPALGAPTLGAPTLGAPTFSADDLANKSILFIMVTAWIVLCVCSLIYQLCIQKSKKDRERMNTESHVESAV